MRGRFFYSLNITTLNENRIFIWIHHFDFPSSNKTVTRIYQIFRNFYKAFRGFVENPFGKVDTAPLIECVLTYAEGELLWINGHVEENNLFLWPESYKLSIFHAINKPINGPNEVPPRSDRPTWNSRCF